MPLSGRDPVDPTAPPLTLESSSLMSTSFGRSAFRTIFIPDDATLGVAVVDAVAATTGIEAGLKWPNDILVGERKLGGILAEVAAPDPVIVVVLGLNVSLEASEIDGAGPIAR